MITLQLRELEADGIISRHVFREVPPRVEYEITDYGRSLEPIIESMQGWGKSFKAQQLRIADTAPPAKKRAPRQKNVSEHRANV